MGAIKLTIELSNEDVRSLMWKFLSRYMEEKGLSLDGFVIDEVKSNEREGGALVILRVVDQTDARQGLKKGDMVRVVPTTETFQAWNPETGKPDAVTGEIPIGLKERPKRGGWTIGAVVRVLDTLENQNNPYWNNRIGDVGFVVEEPSTLEGITTIAVKFPTDAIPNEGALQTRFELIG